MSVIFGTLGWRAKSLMPTIKSTPNIEKLVLYHSSHKNSLKARDKVVEYCDNIGLLVNAFQLDDAFDLLPIARRIKRDLAKERKEGREVSIFNIAGGTRLMSSAALLVCILEGIPTLYVHDDTYEEIPLPLLQIKYSVMLTDKQKEILKFLLRNKIEEYSEKALADAMSLHKATMNYHIKQLVEKGAITINPSKKDSRIKIVKHVPGIELLLSD